MGFETSCDETAVAILRKQSKSSKVEKKSEVIFSQISKHAEYGGVVPEIAAREHVKTIDKITQKALNESGLKIQDIDAFCSTMGPGLLGGLIIGSNYSKTLSIALKKPYYAINHLQAHMLIAKMEHKLSYPFLSLLVSGGHSLLVIAHDYHKFKILGETLDDALGEAFDKIAKILGLGYPGGPEIEKLARMSNKQKDYKFPRPLINKRNFNFSFSGLKTAVRRIVHDGIRENEKADIAYNFQNAVSDCLVKKSSLAIDYFKRKYGEEKSFVLSGGVASNEFIRKKFDSLCKTKNMTLVVPKPKYCVDNATMVAYCCLERMLNGDKGDNLILSPQPRWRLSDL